MFARNAEEHTALCTKIRFDKRTEVAFNLAML